MFFFFISVQMFLISLIDKVLKCIIYMYYSFGRSFYKGIKKIDYIIYVGALCLIIFYIQYT